LRAALRNGDISPQNLHVELGEVINETKEGRAYGHELTLFKSMGLGFQDVAVAAFLFERAVQTGRGTMVDLAGTTVAG
jgi:ornithine cyclodeaminase/alanine dehydrogenase-like protein (mu-crystallin family)